MINIYNPSIAGKSLTKTKGFVLASLILGAIALPILLSGQRVQAQNENREHFRDVLGSWVIQVTLDPNSVPPGTPIDFMGLSTFSAGGGYVASNTGPGAGGPPVYGNWERTGHDRVSTTGLRFGFDAAHHFTGVNKVRETLTFNKQGDELTGNVQVDIFLPDGTLLPIHPSGTYHGTRIEIETLK